MVDRVLMRFGLHDLKQRSPHQLSGGEKHRLALASVLAMEPGYLILDEPTSLLDPAGRHEVQEALAAVRASAGILFITQFEEEAVVADRIAIMSEGRLIECCSPQELASQGVFATTTSRVVGVLHERGVDLPRNVLTSEELARELDRVRGQRYDSG